LTDTLRSVANLDALSDQRPGRTRRSGCERLSRKERLVLAELARGQSTDEIGVVLSVSPHTVRTHVKNLMRKLGARTRAHAVAIALSERAIDL
jgi:DNA-binding CsgD family transcriptional regulator